MPEQKVPAQQSPVTSSPSGSQKLFTHVGALDVVDEVVEDVVEDDVLPSSAVVVDEVVMVDEVVAVTPMGWHDPMTPPLPGFICQSTPWDQDVA